MSKIFYDHLVEFNELDKKIKKFTSTNEEKLELWKIIDEIIHHRVFGCIFDHLDPKHHQEFVTKFKEFPHDEGLLEYLTEKISKDVSILLKYELKKLEFELIEWITDGGTQPAKLKKLKTGTDKN